jgi:hypothetical protein
MPTEAAACAAEAVTCASYGIWQASAHLFQLVEGEFVSIKKLLVQAFDLARSSVRPVVTHRFLLSRYKPSQNGLGFY